MVASQGKEFLGGHGWELALANLEQCVFDAVAPESRSGEKNVPRRSTIAAMPMGG
jgi:hypothetical protein